MHHYWGYFDLSPKITKLDSFLKIRIAGEAKLFMRKILLIT